jgi:iron complex outermembrane receptor protein
LLSWLFQKKQALISFINLKEGNYRLAVTHVAHKPMVTAPFSFSNEELKKDLQMVKLSAALKDVSVTAKKPMVEVKADKMIVNVEGTINATGSDALELLRKSPGVQVDKDDNISLSGKNGVQVYIDGRPTPLAAADLAQFLKNLQSSQIESIELITNPSAKYEAAGNAGIINIKLKKNKTFGTNGSVNAGWNIGTYANTMQVLL